jgi:hypothetical protein
MGTSDQAAMSTPQKRRQGALNPTTDRDAVVVQNPPNDPLVMSPEEADLSGIRIITEPAKARDNQESGERPYDK